MLEPGCLVIDDRRGHILSTISTVPDVRKRQSICILRRSEATASGFQ
jgi:hypothetical protein